MADEESGPEEATKRQVTVPERKSLRALQQPRKRNALKHGAFSTADLLPFEDPREFDAMRQAYRQEFEPYGPSEEDCIHTVFQCDWRKQRLRRAREFQRAIAADRIENAIFKLAPPSRPLEDFMDAANYRMAEQGAEQIGKPRDDYQRLLTTSTNLHLELTARIVKLYLSTLPAEFRTELETNVPEPEGLTTADWIVQIRSYIDSVLLPKVAKRRPDRTSFFSAADGFFDCEEMTKDLETEDRLERMKDQALRRFFSIRTHKKLDRAGREKIIDGEASRTSSGPNNNVGRDPQSASAVPSES